MAPVAITRRHPRPEYPQPELDDVELEELSLAHDPTPHRPAPPLWAVAADPWDRLPRVPTHAGPVDFTLADDVDDRDTHYRATDYPDTDDDVQAGDDGWFDDPGLSGHRAGHDGRSGDMGRDVVGGPDGAFDLDEFDPGAAAARWWGQ